VSEQGPVDRTRLLCVRVPECGGLQPRPAQSDLLGNVGAIIAFRSAARCHRFAGEFHPKFQPTDF